MPFKLFALALLIAGAWYVFRDANNKGRPYLGALLATLTLIFPITLALYWLLSPKLLSTKSRNDILCTKCGKENETHAKTCKKCSNRLEL